MHFVSACRSAAAREWALLRGSVVEQLLWLWSPLATVLILFGIFSAGLPEKLPITVLDQDHSYSSRELIRRLDATRTLSVVTPAGDLAKALSSVRSGQAYAAIQIPAGWEVERLRGGQKPMVLYNNTQYYLAAGLISTAARDAVSSLLGEQAVVREARFGGGLSAAAARTGAVRADLRSLFNPQISYELYLSGLLLPILLHIYLVIMVVSAIGREFRQRSVDAWLASASGRLLPALLGKCLPAFGIYFGLGAGLQAILCGLTGGWCAGSYALWFVAMTFFLLVTITLGAFLIALAGNFRIGLSLVGLWVASAPAFSGFAFPMASMTTGARFWGSLLPVATYLPLQQGQWLTGTSFQVWCQQMLTLLAFVGVLAPLTFLLLRWRIARPASWGGR